jgi:hypothetical protein
MGALPNSQLIRWWSGASWTPHVAARPLPLLPPPPVTEQRPWWRWLLYAASFVLAGPLTMVVGIVLWHGIRYEALGT